MRFFWGLCVGLWGVAAAQTVNLAILSDFNGAYGSATYPAALHRAVKTIGDWKVSAVLSAGDLVAGQKASLSASQRQDMWQGFERDVRGPLARQNVPFISTLGNHDAGLAADRQSALDYWKTRPLPQLQERSQFPFRYSLTLEGGQVFLVSLDASRAKLGGEQLAWLRTQLATPAAKTAKIRLVLGHLPFAAVTTDKNKRGEVLAEARALRQILREGRVLLYLSGHHAAFYPGRVDGVAQLASGGIGGRDYLGTRGTARSTVSLLSLDLRRGTADVSAYDIDANSWIETEALPNTLHGLGGPLQRADTFQLPK